jgi:hypothetical protein
MNPDDMDLNFDGKITNKDVRETLHIPVFVTKAVETEIKKKEEDDE